MSNPPTKPVDISSPRQTPDEFLSTSVTGRPGSMPRPSFGTPSSRPVRQGTPSTPPIANIPLRMQDALSSPGKGLPGSLGAPSTLSRTPHSGGSSTPPLGDNPARPLMDDVTEEEMARVLRRHLVPRRVPEGNANAEAQAPSGHAGSSGGGSRRASGSGSYFSQHPPQADLRQQQEDELFPIQYDTHGADITYVLSISFLTFCG